MHGILKYKQTISIDFFQINNSNSNNLARIKKTQYEGSLWGGNKANACNPEI